MTPRSSSFAKVVLLGMLTSLLGQGSARAEEEKVLPKGDVVARRTVNATPAEVYRWLLDLEHHEQMWPEGCTSRWDYGSVRAGVGASVRVTYRASTMRRRLTATLAEGDPGRYLKVDHAGRLGFVTTWTLTELSDQTRVELHTWVDPPPWPLTNIYMNWVRPEWKRCHLGALDQLAQLLTES